MFIYKFIQFWLGIFRVVAFVVTMTTVADHIYKHIAIKLLAITGGNIGTFHHGFGIVTIYMEYRSLHHGGNRSAVIGTAGIFEIGGKANLIINNKMDSTPG